MYFSDLTSYTFLPSQGDMNTLNIGWLEKAHPFTKGEVSEQALDQLFLICEQPVNRTRGYHECQFCEKPIFGLQASRFGRTLRLGSAEIRVASNSGKTYAAPNLIYHYIVDHNYRPPDEFLNALLEPPNYQKSLR